MKTFEVFTIVMIFCAGFCTGVTFMGLYINWTNKIIRERGERDEHPNC